MRPGVTIRTAGALLACCLAGAGAASASPARDAPGGSRSSGAAGSLAAAVTVLAPQPGAELTAGTWVPLAWQASGLGADVCEWEAFLSVDGGRHFAVRLTPHLDRNLRRVWVRLPDLPVRDARLLFRFGDEAREIAVEPAVTFAIRRNGRAVAGPAGLRAGLGEAARPGEPGVVAWTEGREDGGDLEPVLAIEIAPRWEPVARPVALSVPALFPPRSVPVISPAPLATGDRTPASERSARPRHAPARRLDPVSLHQRLDT